MSRIRGVLDEKDRKILVELDRSARQTDSEIAKKVGLSKQVVGYRIQKLVEKEIVNNFYTIVNVGKLGLNSYYIFLQLEKINKQQEIELLEKLTQLDYVGWLVSGTGRWDIILIIYADSISTFEKSLNKTIDICGEHLHEYTFTTLLAAEHISYKFLAETRDLHSVRQTARIETAELDETGKSILETISQNARLSVVDISEKTKIPVHVVSYRLRTMVKQKMIEGFKPKINVNKLGYQWHLMLIQFQRASEKRKQEFISFCKENKRIYYITNTIGPYNLTLDIHVKSTEEFKEVLLELKEKFSDVIKLYESFVIFDEYKINYFPSSLL